MIIVVMDYKVYGCKVNKFYLNKWLTYFENTHQNYDDVFLVATCVVTDRAKVKWEKEILNKLVLGKRIFLAGCGSLARGDAMQRDVFFDYYPLLKPYQDRIVLLPEDPSLQGENCNTFRLSQQKLWTKNYVIIQNGCDNNCSFCLTIFKRGKHRNRPLHEIIDEIKQIENEGGKEIVITGINLAAWGCENTRNSKESKFNDLLNAIINETSIPRIRISSLDPQYLNNDFFSIVSNKRFCPHFHFSIQSFSDRVLSMMNRSYSEEKISEVLENIRSLKRDDSDFISIGADIISGFPGETEEDFLKTCEGIKKYGITKLHAFPFSDHHKAERIPASLLPDQIPQQLRKKRNQKIIEIGDSIRSQFIMKNYGRLASVLVEEHRGGIAKGWTDNYIQVFVPGDYSHGTLVDILLDENNCYFK